MSDTLNHMVTELKSVIAYIDEIKVSTDNERVAELDNLIHEKVLNTVIIEAFREGSTLHQFFELEE